MLLQDYISNLLHEHNCVIVPNFGGFVANYRSAVVEEFSKKIHPPSKSVLFNPHLTTNDGLLGNYISIDKKVDYVQALSFISDEVTGWNEKLKNNERIEFGEIGFLYRKNDKIQFEQSRETNLLLAAYGLRSIDFVRFSEVKKENRSVETVKIQRPVEKQPDVQESKVEETKVENKVVVEPIKVVEEKTPKLVAKEKVQLDESLKIESVESTETVEEVNQPIKRNVFGTVVKYTAAAVFVPILFYSYWIPMETDALDTGLVQFSDFNPIHKQAERTYDLRHDVASFAEIEQFKSLEELTENIDASVYNFELLEDFYVPVALQKEELALTEEIDKTQVVEVTQVNTYENNEVQSGNYHVISGCFSVQDNANNLVADLNSKGFSAQILDKKGGLHRVSAGGYASKDAAKKAVDQLQSNGFSGWVLKY